ncbi:MULTISPECIES: Rrf2 family transcriptional regulator [unclassified Oceanispirochaeta]|uniref:RrF2 family transcriptional regulator n=1 Tax=unclassified Oceanispirochaeta TaxID=2635722 RepID=UPI000E09BA47|nr:MULTISPECIES: Rrf2 family transcriptional regulator [unclassified Oceanispirochaeta]MBF9017065.1 Rrf2 family transcriptional regulator [Oceanispirochaeta sp. M2]NPD73514.1 Rrf2 family transcriptional regulator [Oceanispirochaeta sp. M1]RDG30804.1 Rrf2 family transcriptional regulator [Oceanispirochaeta sp. M1]
MKLSTKSRYAVRLMINLAWNYKQGPSQLNEIARKEEISEKYLSQIVINLRAAGLIRSVRGAHGGYLLTQNPALTTLKEIVEVMEGGLDIVDCLTDEDNCGRSGQCLTRNVWNKVSQAIKDTLADINLADLSKQVNKSNVPMYFI